LLAIAADQLHDSRVHAVRDVERAGRQGELLDAAAEEPTALAPAATGD